MHYRPRLNALADAAYTQRAEKMMEANVFGATVCLSVCPGWRKEQIEEQEQGEQKWQNNKIQLTTSVRQIMAKTRHGMANWYCN